MMPQSTASGSGPCGAMPSGGGPSLSIVPQAGGAPSPRANTLGSCLQQCTTPVTKSEQQPLA